MENFSGEKDKSKESEDHKKVKILFNKLVMLFNYKIYIKFFIN